MSTMLESYSISSDKKGDYKLKFKVPKGVKVAITTKNDINIINLTYDSSAKGGDNDKNIKGATPLQIQFFQHHAGSLGKGDPINPDPNIIIKP
ncbi:hypothetical protein [Urechidicola croceus]|uniref:Uncharacterized protein n=1 Tax=Urechidicola croceus TaxID=1850246 RepID=A0A1D8P781_9FLAO|nr:hypothetical protein [Urechidicola croceus]AOW20408.1 hypothetical protein LPB138_06850 [Urechidicola croceus]